MLIPQMAPRAERAALPHGALQELDISYVSPAEEPKIGRRGTAREAARLKRKKIKTSLARRFAMIHPRGRHNKRKEVIRCLMVQQ
ncbi:MAG TPA: hypothetical protein VE891_01600 [Allosphingosinicella sp.]|nr:hypothetical protein [Allosphingosinicella sp.]